ncbi:MAG: hypothetical protein JXQ71_15025 [Verrucomicrobia bacterium]|nr:hypothetical protein [Verrucomicrobiota bacterium]
MGYFSKKTDPLSQRARALHRQIASLEAQIQRLTAQQQTAPPNPHPRRTATRPSPARSAPPSEPLFEDLPRQGFRRATPQRKAAPDRENAPSAAPPRPARKLARDVKAPPGSNAQLVNYLAAGSIQGLRPLRYEKRVARNRFLFLVVFLVLLLLGILTSFIRY